MRALRIAAAWLALAAGASGCWMRVAPDDPRLRYTGRVDRRDPAGPRFSNVLTAVAVRVESPAVRLHLRDVPYRRFDGQRENNRYELLIDGAPAGFLTAREPEWTHTVELPPGPHVVELVKRTEPEVGQGQLVSLELPFGGRVLAPPERPSRRLEIIGDSLTTGFGNVGAGPRCPFGATTEDAYRSYGALAARALQAELHVVAWGGRGVVRNYDLSAAGTLRELYPRTLPEEPWSRWDFSRWTPDAVVIYLGTNDFSHPDLDEDTFDRGYLELVTTVRRHYPDAHILCAYPSLSDDRPEGLKRWSRSRAAVDRVMAKLADAGVTRVKAFAFDRAAPDDGLGCLWHPSLPTHEAQAAQLRDLLAETLGW